MEALTTQVTPEPTPDQAVNVLRILGEWTKRGFTYRPRQLATDLVSVTYTYDDGLVFRVSGSSGVNHFDALCQATTVMQVLLEEHPGKQ